MRLHHNVLATMVLAMAGSASALDAVQLGQTFSTPVFLTAPTGDPRLFIVEKRCHLGHAAGRCVTGNDASAPTSVRPAGAAVPGLSAWQMARQVHGKRYWQNMP